MEFKNDLSDIFKNTSATYKFYWFLAIIETWKEERRETIPFSKLVSNMIGRAWHTVHYSDLSFGKIDMLRDTCIELQESLNISVKADRREVQNILLSQKNDPYVENCLSQYYKNVPYRLLSLWINFKTQTDTVIRSKYFENGCLYRINNDSEKSITINPVWQKYLLNNYESLVEFSLCSLESYLKNCNPKADDIRKAIRGVYNTCPFCNINNGDIIAENEYALAFFDKFPVNKGHTLIIPKRHIANYFDLTEQEQISIRSLIQQVKDNLDSEYSPDGYNIGVNINESAGQSIFHVHIHVIPRFKGDVEEPKGGVRGVIPAMQGY